MRAFVSSLSARPSSSRFRTRITAGRLRPWITSVPRMTANVRKMMSSRFGNGSPASVVSGMASAAASETAPRIPDQATIVAPFQGSASVADIPRRSSRATKTPGKMKMKRAPITDCGHDGGVERELAGREARERVHDRGQLQADERKEAGRSGGRRGSPRRRSPGRRVCALVSSSVCQPR